MAKKTTPTQEQILDAIETLKAAGLLPAGLLPDEAKRVKRYTLAETADKLGVTYRTALSYVKEGRLKAHKVGGKWNINSTDLKAFMR
jgi:excisionase family DNA binding protein